MKGCHPEGSGATKDLRIGTPAESDQKILRVMFDVLWRLAILALPWQTRWFRDNSLVGWPWEQGRVSVYASWIVIIATIGVGYFIRRGGAPSRRKHWQWVIPVGVLLLVTFINGVFDQLVQTPSSQWWLQVVILALFVWTLRRTAVSWKRFATWFVLALVPVAMLTVVQYALQHVAGSSLFGIAEQIPSRLGVSVVEHGAFRVLRAYGSFPHPNILGGWLAIGLVTSFLLASYAESKQRALLAIFSSALFSVALLLTYSRNAWIAAVVGIAIVSAHVLRVRSGRQFLLVAMAASLLAAGIVGFSQRDHLFARGNTSSRLEAQSIDARVKSLQDGWGAFQRNMVIGTGPNSELLFIGVGARAAVNGMRYERSPVPLEPPHTVFLLGLVDFGIIGSLALIALLVLGSNALRKRSSPLIIAAYVCPLVILALFDHYLWSTWSGQVLVAIAVFLSMKPQTDP